MIAQIEREIRAVMLLTGAGSVPELRKLPRLIFEPLKQWMTLSAG